MDNKISLFNGVILANPVFLVVNTILLGLIIYYIVSKYKVTNWLVDFWNVSLLFTFIIPVLVLYPFSASKFNMGATGVLYQGAVDNIDYIYFVNIMALPLMFLGKIFFDNYLKEYLFFEKYRLLIYNSITSNIVFILLFVLTIIMLLVIIVVQYQNNVLFNPRSFFHADNKIRPIYNATLFIFGITSIILGLRILRQKSILNIVLFGILIGFGLFLGTRGALLGGILNFIMIYFYINYSKVKIKYVILVFITFLFLIVGLQSLRERNLSFNKFKDIGYDLAYGNSFSDLRDFAIVYSKWDKELLYGKTYLAGAISFIPRSMSNFRDNWSLGVFTIKTITKDDSLNALKSPKKLNKKLLPGISVKNHPGMRPGSFGEMYFNFGIIGVIILAFVLGIFVRFVDFNIKQICYSTKDPFAIYSFIFMFGLMSCFMISVGFSNFYFTNIILIGAYFVVNFRNKNIIR